MFLCARNNYLSNCKMKKKSVKFSVLWLGKKSHLVREKSMKNQEILFLTEGGHPGSGSLLATVWIAKDSCVDAQSDRPASVA